MAHAASPKFLSQAEFARHRKVSRNAVTTWKGKGLLVFADDGKVNVEETEWKLDERPPKYRGGVTHRPIRTRSGDNPLAGDASKLKPSGQARRPAEVGNEDEDGNDLNPDAPNLTPAEAVRRKENFLGLLRKQEFETKGRVLVDRAAAERAFFESARDLRDAWLSWPARVAVIMASELKIEARALTTVLTAHVQQHLSELGEPTADFARDG